MTITRVHQLVLAAPAVVAAVVMSLSGLPGRGGLGDALRGNCNLDAYPSGWSPPHDFASKGVRIDWGPVLTAPEMLSCQLVTLFEAAAWPPLTFWSAPPHRLVLIIWVAYLPTILALLHLTAHRNRVLWLPPVLGFYQWAAAALCFPLFSAFFLPRLLPPTSLQFRPYTRSSIEGLVLGLALGYFLPSYHLLFSTSQDRQAWTLGWQFFPVTVYLVQQIWVRVRGRSVEVGDVGRARWGLLGGMCVLPSVAGHVLLLSRLPKILSLVPPLHTSPSHSLLQLAHHTLAWDLFLTHVSVILTVASLGHLSSPNRSLSSTAVSLSRITLGTLVGGLGVGIGWEWWVSYGRPRRSIPPLASKAHDD